MLNVTDQRRLTLWVAFGWCCWAATGLDHLALAAPRLARSLAVVALGGGGAGDGWLGGPIARSRADLAPGPSASDITRRPPRGPTGDRQVYLRRAERQVRRRIDFLPNLLLVSGELAVLAALAALTNRGVGTRLVRPCSWALTLAELAGFGVRAEPGDRAPQTTGRESPVVAYLRRELGQDGTGARDRRGVAAECA